MFELIKFDPFCHLPVALHDSKQQAVTHNYNTRNVATTHCGRGMPRQAPRPSHPTSAFGVDGDSFR